MKEKRKGRRKRNTEEKLLLLGSSLWNTAWRARRLEKRGEGGGREPCTVLLIKLTGSRRPLGCDESPVRGVPWELEPATDSPKLL